MIAGAFGDGMWTWLSSCPFDVLTKIRSPQMTGDEFDMLCGYEPTSSIMSNDQIDVGVVLAGELLVGDRPVVLAVAEAVDVQAPDHAAVAGVVDVGALDERRRGDALIRPVVGAARRQLLVGLLPEELAVRFAERHQHAAIARPASDRAELSLLVPTSTMPPATTGLP